VNLEFNSLEDGSITMLTSQNLTYCYLEDLEELTLIQDIHPLDGKILMLLRFKGNKIMKNYINHQNLWNLMKITIKIYVIKSIIMKILHRNLIIITILSSSNYKKWLIVNNIWMRNIWMRFNSIFRIRWLILTKILFTLKLIVSRKEMKLKKSKRNKFSKKAIT